MTSLQWITMNPHTKEGIVVAPTVPHATASYEQTLEWSAVRHLMQEVRDAGGGDMDLNAIYIRACEHYCDNWEEEPQAEPGPPKEIPT